MIQAGENAGAVRAMAMALLCLAAFGWPETVRGQQTGTPGESTEAAEREDEEGDNEERSETDERDEGTFRAAIRLPEDGPTLRGGPTFRLGAAPGPDSGVVLLSGGAIDLAVGEQWLVGAGAIWADGNLDGTEVYYAGLRGAWFQQLPSWFWLTGRLTLGGGVWIENPSGLGNERRNPMFVAEPEVMVGVSITPSARLSVGASYRLAVSEAGALGTDGRLGLSGPTATVQVEYGATPAGDTSMFRAPAEGSVYSGLSGVLSVQLAEVAGHAMFMEGAATRVLLREVWGLGLIGNRGHVVEDGAGRQWRSIYGGVLVQRIIAPERLIHGSGMAVVGLGSTGFVPPDTDQAVTSLHGVTELAGFVEMNVTGYLRLAVGGGYRLGVPFDDDAGLSVGDVSSPIGLVQLRFGRFE